MIIIENETAFANPYRYGAFYIVNLSTSGKSNEDFYCIAENEDEIRSQFPDVIDHDIIDRTGFVLEEGPAPQSLKRLLEENRFGRIECSVGDGLHQRKWRWCTS